MYKSSDGDACCIGDEDPSSAQGDCVSQIFVECIYIIQFIYTGQSAAYTSLTGEHASSPKDDVVHVS